MLRRKIKIKEKDATLRTPFLESVFFKVIYSG